MLMRLLRRARYWLNRSRHAAELAEEMELHRSLTSGRAFGNVTLAREDARGVWIRPWLETGWQDLRYAGRALVREPGFALLAVVTLGCAVGLNTSLFTVFHAVALRPWPVNEPSRLLTVLPGVSVAEYEYFTTHARSFSGLAAVRCLDGVRDGCALKLEDTDITANVVSGNYFRVLGVDMARGPGFGGDADRLDVPTAVAVISYATWQARFAQDPGTVGKVIRLDDVPFTIVGIAGPRFNGTSLERVGVWIPLSALSLVRPQFIIDHATLGTRSVDVRLAGGVSVEQARAELELLHRQYGTGRSSGGSRILVRDTTLLPAGSEAATYQMFALMWVGVALVLILACANVGNLLLARATTRRVEIGVRLSIGASRSRILRQLFTESLVIAACSAIVGIVIAWTLPAVLIEWFVGPVGFDPTPDTAVLGYTAVLAVVTCLAFGLAPALHGSRTSLTGILSGRTPIPGTRMPLGGVLLAVQVAVSVILLVTASLMVRGVRALASQEVGFDIDGVDVISFELPASYSTARVRAFGREVIENARQTFGTQPVGLAGVAPFGKADRLWTSVRVRGDGAAERESTILTFEVSPGYFDVLRLPFIAGRNFVESDREARAVIINERMARWYWPGGNAVGQTFVSGEERRVVGVVKTVPSYYADPVLTGPTMYEPIEPRIIPQVLIRHAGPGGREAAAAFAAAIEPSARVRIAPLSLNRARLIAAAQVGPMLASGLGVLAVVLASIGVFSIFAYAVAQRRTEIGIRLALGAPPAHIVSLVIGTSGRALLVGIGAGVMGAAAGSHVLRSFLYGISPFDPAAYLSAAALLTIAGVAATLVPARRATRVDPLVALRHE
jgi:predicted permease